MSDTLETAFEMLFTPLVQMVQEKSMSYHNLLTDAIIGEHASKEVEPGVWQHTYAPPQQPMRFIPRLCIEAQVRKLFEDLLKSPEWKSYHTRNARLKRQRRRERRQHRSAFRRRKRGLA